MKSYLQNNFTHFIYFYNRLKFRIFIRMGLSLSVGILDGFGLAMFLPLLHIAENSANNDISGLGNLDFLIDGMVKLNLSLTLQNILMVMSLFFILKGILFYLSSVYAVYLKQFFIKAIRVSLSNSLTTMSYKSFILSNPGRIQNTLTGEVSKISKAYESYFEAFKQIVLIIVYMSFAFFVEAQFALLICTGGVLTSVLYTKIYKSTKTSSSKVTKGSNLYQGLILQMVSNFKYLKSTGYIERYNQKLLNSINYIEGQNRKIGNLGAVASSIREPILIIIVSVVILIQIELLNGTFGTIMISLLFFYRALTAMILMQTYYNDFLSVSGSLDNMTNFETELKKSQETKGKLTISSLRENIILKDATLKYSNHVIIKHLNLSIHKNSTIAFVGESGSGKTTLVNIITGLLPLNDGQLLIDGVNSRVINLNSYQQKIGYITQEPAIFNDTIFNNITFWADKTPDNINRFNTAIRQAHLDIYLNALLDKEDTILGNNGINLSGGQKQRIAIARELYKQVALLILDEATSALDSETERVIQSGIKELHGKCTIIIIAHRLSTIKHADRIIILDKGEIIDEGSFMHLMERSPKFKQMIALQEV
ncbi:hypothetical protein EL17_20060 [Anditalea andensis]|uniref:ABC transporter ATP-binding protein n=1 Tax=Anditalea andensis TaxID=1048983 RepID=A0A074LEJ9_9BACT|nr:hypothetical protein EL17_20060 [Anditalea andensis]